MTSDLPPLTPELKDIILGLARQPDIRSVSCPFPDYDLWYALIEEQIRRSRAMGVPHPPRPRHTRLRVAPRRRARLVSLHEHGASSGLPPVPPEP
jgi:hypothetical protein